ncbi:MAG: hypothetical protein PHE83_18610 [Opitutaceae bacterium]|nr:hypothetical protein [Opitutaceae bacterium]
MKVPKFLKCTDETGRIFVLHSPSPRILCELRRNMFRWVKDWGEQPPPDAARLARLMREMGEWYSHQ